MILSLIKVVLSCKDVGIYVGNAATGKQLYENISLEVLKGEKSLS